MTEHRSEYTSETQVRAQIAHSVDVSQESICRWMKQHEIDTGAVDDVTIIDREEMRRLKSENTRLRDVNAIRHSAAIFLAGKLCRRNR